MNFLSEKRLEIIAGVDEVGCGALAGPVVASAVILYPKQWIYKLSDSKKLTEKRRLMIYQKIIQYALSWSYGYVNVKEIDSMNIFNARLLAMKRAVLNLSIEPDLILVDGNYAPRFRNIHYQCFVHGDIFIPMISAASIIAKVMRDKIMVELDNQYPKYGFARNKGYPTFFHLKQLKKYGHILHHRKTFFPIKNMIKNY